MVQIMIKTISLLLSTILHKLPQEVGQVMDKEVKLLYQAKDLG